MFRARAVVLLFLIATGLSAAEVWPDRNWGRIENPESAGYSGAGLQKGIEVARSGVYHRASNPGDLLDSAPKRGSQKPGIGLVMLRDGRWRDQQIVPKMWVNLSTRIVTPHADLKPAPSDEKGLAYGSMWWIEERTPDDPLDRAYSASGAFGQYIMVIPKLDMVVAHQVVMCDGTAPDVWVDYTRFRQIVDAVVAARCAGACH